MMNGMGSFGFGGMWFGWLFWLIILGVVIWGIVSFSNSTKRNHNLEFGNHESPLDILKRRYAKGEITQDEYKRLKTELHV